MKNCYLNYINSLETELLKRLGDSTCIVHSGFERPGVQVGVIADDECDTLDRMNGQGKAEKKQSGFH